VQSGIHDALAVRLAEQVAGLQVGAGVETGVVQGPLINAAALAKVELALCSRPISRERASLYGRGGFTLKQPVRAAGETDQYDAVLAFRRLIS
jgi:acyl-CoA reductase-like NAD-dependent aldehyde dehydrogenase